MEWSTQHRQIETRIRVEDHQIGWRSLTEPGRVAEPFTRSPGACAQGVLGRAELRQRRNLLADQAVRKKAAGISSGVDRDTRVQGFREPLETTGVQSTHMPGVRGVLVLAGLGVQLEVVELDHGRDQRNLALGHQ